MKENKAFIVTTYVLKMDPITVEDTFKKRISAFELYRNNLSPQTTDIAVNDFDFKYTSSFICGLRTFSGEDPKPSELCHKRPTRSIL
jgi:hypothetical protein